MAIQSVSLVTAPQEMRIKIFHYLTVSELGKVCTLCRLFNREARDNTLWRSFFEDRLPPQVPNGVKEYIQLNTIRYEDIETEILNWIKLKCTDQATKIAAKQDGKWGDRLKICFLVDSRYDIDIAIGNNEEIPKHESFRFVLKKMAQIPRIITEIPHVTGLKEACFLNRYFPQRPRLITILRSTGLSPYPGTPKVPALSDLYSSQNRILVCCNTNFPQLINEICQRIAPDYYQQTGSAVFPPRAGYVDYP
jgi:hypothetical protein